MFQKIPKIFHDKAVQSNILRINLNKISGISFLQSAHKQGTPHFIFMRRAQNSDTHALKQHRLSQNISTACSSFGYRISTCTDMHLESESEKRAKNVDLHTTNNIKIQPTLFRYF